MPHAGCRNRSALRIRDGREKPIDILAKNILLLQAQVGGAYAALHR
jgi:hypothetical protein